MDAEWSSPDDTSARDLQIPAGGALIVAIGAGQSATLPLTPIHTQLPVSEQTRHLRRQFPNLRGPVHIRLLGPSTWIQSMAPHITLWGCLEGKHVMLDPNTTTTLQIFPTEGRLRMARRKTRVLVIDDSSSIQTLLRKIIQDDTDLECVGTVGHPNQAAAAIETLRPDVLTLDIHMPEKNGVQLLRELLPRFQIPTVMISALSKEDGTFVLDALEAGAVDYIQKPSLSELPIAAPLIREKLKQARSANVRNSAFQRTVLSNPTLLGPLDPKVLIAIGSSTGGTEALKNILTQLPASIPPMLIVQHIPPVFSKAFADRMASLCPFAVKEAGDGDRILPNQVLIAPGGLQMGVRAIGADLFVALKDAPPVNRHKPSVDYLFESLALCPQRRYVAGLLTGMGADGAKGLLKLKSLGAFTLAQDEATCVVYGMPREAARLGAAQRILPLQDIAAALMEGSRFRSKVA